MSATRSASAVAHPNIALAKYWGKRGFGHNLPAVPSLSVTLAGMRTRTTVRFDAALPADALLLNGAPAPSGALARASGLLDRVRAEAGSALRAAIASDNDFPTSAGLASSASAFAALALAARAAFGLSCGADDVSDLARRTSVSAARSAFGGFAALRAGVAGDERLAAESVAPPDHWDLRVVVAVTTEAAKEVSSTKGMLHTVETSPYYPAWVEDAPRLFAAIRAAVLARDLEALGVAAEASALRMHASAIAAGPGVVYWSPATLAAMATVRALRARGVGAWSTIDAGPHVKVLTLGGDEDAVVRALQATPGVLRTLCTRPGAGASSADAP